MLLSERHEAETAIPCLHTHLHTRAHTLARTHFTAKRNSHVCPLVATKSVTL